MSVSASSLLSAYDPTNPSSIASALTGAGLSDSYYTLGLNGTGSYDPGTESPTSAVTASNASLSSSSTSASSGLNTYQQALASLQEWSDQTLITAALSGTGTSSDSSDSSSLSSVLETAAENQQSTQAAQQQAALNAAQSAMAAGTTIDTTA